MISLVAVVSYDFYRVSCVCLDTPNEKPTRKFLKHSLTVTSSMVLIWFTYASILIYIIIIIFSIFKILRTKLFVF